MILSPTERQMSCCTDDSAGGTRLHLQCNWAVPCRWI